MLVCHYTELSMILLIGDLENENNKMQVIYFVWCTAVGLSVLVA